MTVYYDGSNQESNNELSKSKLDSMSDESVQKQDDIIEPIKIKYH